MRSSDVTEYTEERKTILRKAVAKLPAKQQMVVLLRSFQELSFKEVADITSFSENSVKVNFSHALRKLRMILQWG